MDSKLREALYKLEEYNGIFRQLFELGRIQFVDSEYRAYIQFDEEGKELRFCMDRKFYNSISADELTFVIIHECLHVLLFHGIRRHYNNMYKINSGLFNTAADIAIHEIIFKHFGFDRNLVTIEHVTRENIFTDCLDKVAECESADYYFDKMIQEGIAKETDEVYIDAKYHGVISDMINKAYKRLSEVEKKELKKKLNEVQGKLPGDGTGEWFSVEVVPLKKKKWEVAIKDWAASFIQADKFDWSKKNRRISSIKTNLFLPSYQELNIKRLKVWLFMDTSGSCYHLADRFFSAAASLPKKFFDPRLFCFDTQIYETSISKREVKGGGGTAFDIIQNFITEEKGHPDYVFVITDGAGNMAHEEFPKKWHIFLTENNKSCFSNDCVFHDFSEFE